MSSYIQLLCLLLSFIYGYVVNKFNNIFLLLVKKMNIFFKFIIYLAYVVIFSLLYIFILFKINRGILHYYFVIFIVIGYIIGYVKRRKYYD